MHTGRGLGGVARPDLTIDLHMGKLLADLQCMLAKTGKTALLLPAFTDAAVGTTEDRHEVIADLDLMAEVFHQFVEADLRGIGPDTEDIGKVVQANHGAC